MDSTVDGIDTDDISKHDENAETPITLSLLGRFNSAKEWHESNARVPMWVIVAGISNNTKLSQPVNASSSIDALSTAVYSPVTFTDSNNKHLEKAFLPIRNELFGSVTFLMRMQLINASFPISLTVDGTIIDLSDIHPENVESSKISIIFEILADVKLMQL